MLEPLLAVHEEELWPVAQDSGTWDFMAFDVRSPDDLTAWVNTRIAARDAGTALPFLVRSRAGDALGSTSIFDVTPHRTMEVGHTWLALGIRRSRVNTECKRLLLGHCFESLGAIRVQLKCDERNLPSRRAIERIGATYEGTIRNQMVLADGHRRQALVYSILDTEWPGVRDRLDSLLSYPGPPTSSLQDPL